MPTLDYRGHATLTPAGDAGVSASERVDLRMRLQNIAELIAIQMTERGALKPDDVTDVLQRLRRVIDDIQTPEAHRLRYAASLVPGGQK